MAGYRSQFAAILLKAKALGIPDAQVAQTYALTVALMPEGFGSLGTQFVQFHVESVVWEILCENIPGAGAFPNELMRAKESYEASHSQSFEGTRKAAKLAAKDGQVYVDAKLKDMGELETIFTSLTEALHANIEARRQMKALLLSWKARLDSAPDFDLEIAALRREKQVLRDGITVLGGKIVDLQARYDRKCVELGMDRELP